MDDGEIPAKCGLFSSTVRLGASLSASPRWCYARRLPDDPTKREDGWSTPPRHEPTTSGTPIAGRLRDTLTETTYDTWFGQAQPRSFTGEQLVVEVPNDFTREWIEGHFLDLVTRAAGETRRRARS